MKKKVVVQLPPVAKEAPVTTRYALELEALEAAGPSPSPLLRPEEAAALVRLADPLGMGVISHAAFHTLPLSLIPISEPTRPERLA